MYDGPSHGLSTSLYGRKPSGEPHWSALSEVQRCIGLNSRPRPRAMTESHVKTAEIWFGRKIGIVDAGESRRRNESINKGCELETRIGVLGHANHGCLALSRHDDLLVNYLPQLRAHRNWDQSRPKWLVAFNYMTFSTSQSLLGVPTCPVLSITAAMAQPCHRRTAPTADLAGDAIARPRDQRPLDRPYLRSWVEGVSQSPISN